eukprot:COSAG02_NODE_1446_length_12578_cov_3.488661_5_plen_60_part_00
MYGTIHSTLGVSGVESRARVAGGTADSVGSVGPRDAPVLVLPLLLVSGGFKFRFPKKAK